MGPGLESGSLHLQLAEVIIETIFNIYTTQSDDGNDRLGCEQMQRSSLASAS